MGCKIIPKFKLNNKIIEPLHSANWIGESSDEFNALPGILKNLRGEFPCVPFGINSPVENISDDWKDSYSEEPYVVNEPHGFCANKNWELLEKISNKYNVQPRFIVALWGIETDYGRISGGFPVIASLVTLS